MRTRNVVPVLAVFLLISLTGNPVAQEETWQDESWLQGEPREQDNGFPEPESALFPVRDDKNQGIPSQISPLERLAKTLLGIPKTIGQGISDALSLIPGLRGARERKAVLSVGDILEPIKGKIRAIYPGTLWCGDGDIARNEQDLGFFRATDACCREHDSCKFGIAPGQTEHNLLNNGIFTRSRCDCDEKFYGCLKEARNIIATKIGLTYFNVLRPQCFRKDYPIVGCKMYAKLRLVDDTCVEYKLNETAPQKYQWFDNQNFL